MGSPLKCAGQLPPISSLIVSYLIPIPLDVKQWPSGFLAKS